MRSNSDNYNSAHEASPESLAHSVKLFAVFAQLEVAANAFGWSLDRISKVVENPPAK